VIPGFSFPAVLGYPGMDAGGEAVFGGHPAEQPDELLAFVGVEAGAELVLVLGRGIHDRAQDAAALAGEVEGADSAVPGNRPPLDKAALLEPVDKRHHAAGRDLQGSRQRPLGLPFGCAHVSQQHHFARIEAEPGHPVSPQTRRVKADLGEQEGGTGHAQAVRGRPWISHVENLTWDKRFLIGMISEVKLTRDRIHGGAQIVDGDDRDPDTEGLVIETYELGKRYGEDIVAVDRLTMRVRRGEVYGFLGPNGAGKTTTLRMLLGLIRPDSGSALVLDAAPGSPAGLARLGALVETPAFYPFLSGRDNLCVLARHAGVPEARVHAALDEVKLTGRAGDPFGTYSLGMKQRLGVAAALLKNPELLILDEPTNGMDAAGMAEMRAFIRGLAREGRTVLLSSHLMSEVEQICDRVGVIRSGKLVGEGTLDELRGRTRLRVRAEPLEVAARLVAALRPVEEVAVEDGSLLVSVDPAAAAAINRELVEGGIAVSELRRERASLETIFLELTEGEEGG
jgi:ABC-type multidrug transport system ATPase subunit